MSTTLFILQLLRKVAKVKSAASEIPLLLQSIFKQSQKGRFLKFNKLKRKESKASEFCQIKFVRKRYSPRNLINVNEKKEAILGGPLYVSINLHGIVLSYDKHILAGLWIFDQFRENCVSQVETVLSYRRLRKTNFNALTSQLKPADVAADDRFLRQTMMRPAPICPLCVLPRDIQYHKLATWEHMVFAICENKNSVITVIRNESFTEHAPIRTVQTGIFDFKFANCDNFVKLERTFDCNHLENKAFPSLKWSQISIFKYKP